MKKIFIILASSFLCVSIFASNPLTVSYSNVENTSNGMIKENTVFSKETNEPKKRSIFKYDLDGNIQEKIVYQWGGKSKGWVADQKLTYTYGKDKSTPQYLSLTKWDNKAKSWSSDAKMIDYTDLN